MVKYREILRLHAMGVSMRNISFSCKCSKTTVKNVVDRAKATGLAWPLPEEMGDAATRAILHPQKAPSETSKADIDHERVASEMERPGVTMTVLWASTASSRWHPARSRTCTQPSSRSIASGHVGHRLAETILVVAYRRIVELPYRRKRKRHPSSSQGLACPSRRGIHADAIMNHVV